MSKVAKTVYLDDDLKKKKPEDTNNQTNPFKYNVNN